MVVKNKAQISTQFAWIFILIAGAIIMMFFVSLVFKQKTISENKLSATVLTQIETILTGAGLSTGTVNSIDIPGTELEFVCDSDGYSDFGIRRSKFSKETTNQIIFASSGTRGNELLTLALGWKAPFKVMNFLYVSDPNTKYVFITNSNDPIAAEVASEWRNEFIHEIKGINELHTISTVGFDRIKLVFFNTNPSLVGATQLHNKKIDVSAIKVLPSSVEFFKRDGITFQSEGISLAYLDTPSLFGAIFSQDKEFYECNMKKAFRKLFLVSQVYDLRQLELKTVSDSNSPCRILYDTDLTDALPQIIKYANISSRYLTSPHILELGSNIAALENNKMYLVQNSCPVVY